MNTAQRLLYMLENCDAPISGELIAKELNISRNAVWKAINSLRAEGFVIDATSRKGYALSKKNTRFSVAGIERHLNCGCNISIYETLESTNITAKQQANDGALQGTVIIARQQTGGKGRLGREFLSKPGGLYMSIVLRPDLPPNDTTLITTAAAVAVCRAVDKVCSINTGIKWVNDIFWDGKKICGILTQGSVSLENGSIDYAVLGIGLNINRPKNDFPKELKSIAGSIYDTPCDSETQNRIIAEILNEFFAVFENIAERDFLEEYRSRSVIIGKEVVCVTQNGEFAATVKDIDNDAHLIVATRDGKEHTLSSGEVRVKV